MKRRSILAAAAIVAGTVASPFIGGSSAHAECTYHVITKIPTTGGLLYVDDRKPRTEPLPGLVAPNGEGTWVYAEDTGDTNLQWGDPFLGVDELKAVNAENCTSMNPHDLMIF